MIRKPFTEAEITSDVLDLRNEADSVWFSTELCSSGVVERVVNRIRDKRGWKFHLRTTPEGIKVERLR